MYEAIEDDRQRWRAAINIAIQEVDQALQDYHHAQRQLDLADKRAGQARFVISRSGYPIVIRPRGRVRVNRARVVKNGSKYQYLFPS